jgi:hypothetical protein
MSLNSYTALLSAYLNEFNCNKINTIGLAIYEQVS